MSNAQPSSENSVRKADRPRLVAIAIVASNGVLGDGSEQPFTFGEDWKRFKQVTTGHPMIAGRVTHELTGFLPGRFSVIISRNPDQVQIELDEAGQPRGVAVATLEEAIAEAGKRSDLAYVIGGGEIYRMAWPVIDEIDLSEVHMPAEGSVKLPEIDPEIWVEVSRDPRGAFDFVRYQRRADLS